MSIRSSEFSLSTLILLLALILESLSCAGPPNAGVAAAGPKSEIQNSQSGSFSVPENQLAHLQVRPVQREDWSIIVRTTGTVDWDADHTTQAITQVTGPITEILVDTGSFVEANDPLLYVSSPDVTNAIATYRKARNRLNFESAALERSRDLLTHKALAQKDFESVEADYNDAATDLQNSLQALRIFGITANEIEEAQHQGVSINPRLAVRSPIKGIVVQKLVFPGQLIQAGATVCFVISDPSTVWVQGHIYERDLTAIRIGDSVSQTNPALPGVFHGVISYIGAMVDPLTRTTPVRIVTGNPKGLLKKDLVLDTVIQTRTKRNVLTVPTSAVLYDSDNLPFVYVQTEGNRFAQRQATAGIQQDGKLEILSGLKEGDKIVSEGAVFLQFANTYQQ
jgi:cobalt-zinc-cadmium efflux system membrane fusion protein